jgi:hypothetical protein
VASLDGSATRNRRVLASIALLVSWELWNERNARVFRNKHAPPLVIFDKIKREASLCVLAGDKKLSGIIPGE